MLSDLLPRADWAGGVDAPPRPLPPGSIPDPVMPPAPPASPKVPHFVAFTVADQDGAALRGTFRCEVAGVHEDGELGDAEIRREPIDGAASPTLTLRPTGYLRRSRSASPWRPPDGDHVVELAPEIGPLALAVDRSARVVVRVPKATVFTIPAYALDLEVFRPGWLRYDEEGGEGITGIGCLVQALAYAKSYPDRHVLVAGHTDTSGSKAHNRGVGERRAEHLAALLRADVETWVASCLRDAELSDLSAHMQWAAGRFGWPCDAGIVAKSTPEFRAALGQWRHHAAEPTGIHVDPEAPHGEPDWRLAYALLDLALSEELDLDLAELAALRTGLRWCDPAIVGAGEVWPREMGGGTKNAALRRTQILFATAPAIPGGVGSPAGASLFGEDAWLWLDYIDPEPRAALTLALQSKEGYVVPSTPFKWVSETGRVRFGRLGEQGSTVIDDVPAGGYRVYWTDPDDVATKIWASRCDAALAAADVAPLRALLEHPPVLVQAVARVYDDRFGGGETGALARCIRTLAEGSVDAVDLDLLLHLAGLPSAYDYEYAGIREAAGRRPGTTGDRGRP